MPSSFDVALARSAWLSASPPWTNLGYTARPTTAGSVLGGGTTKDASDLIQQYLSGYLPVLLERASLLTRNTDTGRFMKKLYVIFRFVHGLSAGTAS